ncbi:MAG: DUF58 domain-containing protein [Lachnospiraceae bacterium]|nr:DUF58 domain-containing protein [Lachnospiraceae bacterium]
MRRILNIFRYIIVITLNVFVMVTFQSYLNFLLLVGMLLFPVYSIYGVWKVKQELRLEIFSPSEAMEKTEEFYLRFVVHNHTNYTLVNGTAAVNVSNRFYGDRGKHYLNIPIRARKNAEVVYPIVMDYCGLFQVNVEQIKLVDLLGIYETAIALDVQRECLVLPGGEMRSQEAGAAYVRGVSEAMESKEKGYDFSEVSGIREYIPGDKLQNIHWKLSVKKDELMVKERVSVSAMQLNVLLDLLNDEEMRLESVLELADSVTKSLVAQNLPFTVYYYSTNLGKLSEQYIGSEIERKQWMEQLLYNHADSVEGRAEDLYKKQFPFGGTYLYIGFMDENQTEDCILGNQQTAAVLRR